MPIPLGDPRFRAAAMYVAYYAGLGAAFPYLPVYYVERGLPLGAIGALVALVAGIGIVGGPLWGSLADRPGRARLAFVGSALVAAGGAAALALTALPLAVVIAAAVMAVGMAGVVPIMDARALDAVGEDRDRFGQVRAWGSGAYVLGSGLVGLLLVATGTVGVFLVWVPALLVAAAIGSSIAARGHRANVGFWSATGTVLAQPAMGRFLVAALLTWIVFMATNAFMSLHLTTLGVPSAAVGIASAIAAAGELPTMWAFPALARRFGVQPLLVTGALMFTLRAAISAFTSEPLVVLAVSAFGGIGFGLFLVGSITYVASRAPAGLAGTAQGVLSAVSFGIAAVVGAGAGGFIADAISIRGLFVVCVLVGAAAMVAVLLSVAQRSGAPAGGLATETPDAR